MQGEAEVPGVTIGRLVLAIVLLTASLARAATFTVTKTADDNGICDADCALREAILAANTMAGADDIVVPAGTYLLSSGSLIASSDLTIAGAGADTTIIDGQGTASVFDVTGVVEMADLTIRNGSPANNGGGIDNGGTLTLTGVVLRDNRPPGGSGGSFTIGGGVYNHGALTVRDSTIANNGASFGGGILNEIGAFLTLINTTMSGNLEDALFDGGQSILINTTIADNSDIGVVRFGSGATRSTRLANTVLANNGVDCSDPFGGIISDGYNFISDGTCFLGGGGGGPFDPHLAPLGDYGGTTPTHALCSGPGVPDASCSAASPLLDAGNPAVPGSGGSACPAADQRAIARGQTRCDIGAYEVACADTIVDAGETCDDGNLTDDDGCDSNCTVTGCGNGVLTPGEVCDDGNHIDTDGCTNACTVCGDGIASAPETCDDMNLVSDDGCDANCTVTACGNGVITSGEDCDDGNPEDSDCCSNTCQPAATGSACADDGFGCSSDLCDGAGHCVHALLGGTVCRPAATACDAVEQCDGFSFSCPADEVAPPGAVCRASAGECDLSEECDGSSPTCPPDMVFPADVVCRVAQGDCDLSEQCTGDAAACPVDLKRTDTCRPATSACDVAESCNGLTNACPANAFAPDGVNCDDGAFCNGVAQCQQGSCAAAPAPCPLACDEGSDQCVTACPDQARSGCRTAEKSILVITDKDVDARDRLVWKWLRGQATNAADFGDPTTSADNVLCLYAGSAQALLAGGEVIVPADGSRWSPVGEHGYAYRDADASMGLQRATLRGGAPDRAKVLLTGKGGALPDPTVPLVPDQLPLVVQLMNSDTPVCWQSTFAPDDVVTNQSGRFRARTP